MALFSLVLIYGIFPVIATNVSMETMIAVKVPIMSRTGKHATLNKNMPSAH